MAKLRYIGPDPAQIGIVPLPEGWGAFDHEDDDEERAKAKLAHRYEGKPTFALAQDEAAPRGENEG